MYFCVYLFFLWTLFTSPSPYFHSYLYTLGPFFPNEDKMRSILKKVSEILPDNLKKKKINRPEVSYILKEQVKRKKIYIPE